MRRSWFVMALLVYLGGLGFMQAQQNQVPRTLTPENRQALQEVFTQHRTSAVRIETLPEGVGSGFFINDRGLVMTAYHVARDANRLFVVTTDERRFPATVVGYDELRDLALLQAQLPAGVQVSPLQLETRAAVRPGDLVLNIGNSRNGFISPRPGLVTGIDRSIAPNFPAGMISSTMPLAPGDSGGPILNAQGRVVGVAVAIGYSEVGEFSSYVAPLVGLGEFVAQMQAGFRRDAPYIGISSPIPVTAEVARQLNVPVGGVIIRTVIAGGAGDRAGLRGLNSVGPNEVPDIILSVEGVQVNDFNQLVTEVRKKSVGDTVTLTVRRAGQIIEVRLTLAPFPRNT
ncbi:MAG: S1C family serine protease [Meiothermus sp.]|nr:S1C family serine protease [Meiothermus sp.]